MAAKNWKWYVYELTSPDGVVFYVGKGTGGRIDQHEIEARSGVVSHKCNKIRSIVESGGVIGKRKVAYFNDEQQAYIHEANRIAEYGLENLTNVVLATTLVPEIREKLAAGKRCFDAIQMFKGKFAYWMIHSKGGRLKAEVKGSGELSDEIIAMFYNKLCPTLLDGVLKTERYRTKFAAFMRSYGVGINYVPA